MTSFQINDLFYLPGKVLVKKGIESRSIRKLRVMIGSKKVLTEKYVTKLYEIFKQNNWEKQEPGKYSVFDRFCERLAELEDDKERDLILELTKNFMWVRSDMYEEYLIKAMKSLFDSDDWNPEKGKNIYICPLLPESDFGKLKSSIFMLYLCQSILVHTFSEFQTEQVRICETPRVLEKHKENIGSVILIDDFIGSGETALGCLEYLHKLDLQKKRIYIVSLIAQEEGIHNIRNIGREDVPVFTAFTRKKAITDIYPDSEISEKLELMRKIGKHLQVKKGFELGYADSESLVAMIRTPNNTFPVYWHENKQHPYAPFVRCKNVKVIRSESK